MAKRKLKAEEIKEKKDLEIKEDEKDLNKKENVKEEVKEDKKDETKTESENLIVLENGATVDENVKLSEEETEDLAKITKADGTEIFVEKVEGEEGEKKEVYEAIIEADTTDNAEEISDELMNEVNDQEIEEVAYVPAACHTAAASLNNSYYILKLKGGKLKALKAGKILNKALKASIIKAYNDGKKLPEAETVFNKIAHKIGYTFGAFTKLASKLSKKVVRKASRILPKVGDTVEIDGKDIKITANEKGVITLENGKKLLAKQIIAADIQDNIPGTDNDKAEELKNFSIKEDEVKKDNVESEIALDSKEFNKADEDANVKAAPSKVKSLYNRLPSKSGVGDEVEWGLKDFNKERNKKEKTMAAQIKSLRDATKELRAQKEVIASKEAEIKALKAKLEEVAKKEATAIKASKIKQIIAALNIDDAEEKAAMTEKFAKYSSEQLDAVYETYTCCPSEEATNMHERMINEVMKKEASELAGFVPAIDLKEELGSEDMEALVLQRELDSQK